jgi:hypothetical protein
LPENIHHGVVLPRLVWYDHAGTEETTVDLPGSLCDRRLYVRMKGSDWHIFGKNFQGPLCMTQMGTGVRSLLQGNVLRLRLVPGSLRYDLMDTELLVWSNFKNSCHGHNSISLGIMVANFTLAWQPKEWSAGNAGATMGSNGISDGILTMYRAFRTLCIITVW